MANDKKPVAVTPTNPISSNKKSAGLNYSSSPTVIAAGHESDGLSIGDYYTNKFGQEFQIIGIGNDGNPLTERVGGMSNAQLAAGGGTAGAGVSAASGSAGGGSGSGGYSAYQYPGATSAEDYIREIYAAQQEANLAALQSAYEQNVLELDAAASKIPAQYTAARNSASGASEIERAAFNEYASANGLSSGTGGQAQLSMSNAMLGNLSSISRAEADAMSDLQLERARLGTDYKNSIAKAVAQGDMSLAQALYTELVRLDNAKQSTAAAQANENFRVWTELQKRS